VRRAWIARIYASSAVDEQDVVLAGALVGQPELDHLTSNLRVAMRMMKRDLAGKHLEHGPDVAADDHAELAGVKRAAGFDAVEVVVRNERNHCVIVECTQVRRVFDAGDDLVLTRNARAEQVARLGCPGEGELRGVVVVLDLQNVVAERGAAVIREDRVERLRSGREIVRLGRELRLALRDRQARRRDLRELVVAGEHRVAIDETRVELLVHVIRRRCRVRLVRVADVSTRRGGCRGELAHAIERGLTPFEIALDRLDERELEFLLGGDRALRIGEIARDAIALVLL